MKKLIFTITLCALAVLFAACDKEEIIVADQLPQTAQAFVSQHFSQQTVVLAKKDNNNYDVTLSDGTDIDFYKSGEWKDVDCKYSQMPQSVIDLLPASIQTYINQTYQQAFIVEVSKENYGFKIDLNIDIEIMFNQDGTFRGID